MTTTDGIELNPKVCNGRPVIKGTRVPVSVILEQIAEDESWDTLLAGYPELKKKIFKQPCFTPRLLLSTQRSARPMPELLTPYLDQMLRLDVAKALCDEGQSCNVRKC